MGNIIVPPQYGNGLLGLGPKTIDIERAPVVHRCLGCKLENVILLPKGPGKMVWLCRCNTRNNLEWGEVPKDQMEGMGAIKPLRRPMIHECQTCGVKDWVVLPIGGGDMRWTCSCGSVWLIRFTPDRWMLAQIRAGKDPAQPSGGGEKVSS